MKDNAVVFWQRYLNKKQAVDCCVRNAELEAQVSEMTQAATDSAVQMGRLIERVAELEKERNRLQKALQAIRDSTHQTALMLRAIANRELSNAREGE